MGQLNQKHVNPAAISTPAPGRSIFGVDEDNNAYLKNSDGTITYLGAESYTIVAGLGVGLDVQTPDTGGLADGSVFVTLDTLVKKTFVSSSSSWSSVPLTNKNTVVSVPSTLVYVCDGVRLVQMKDTILADYMAVVADIPTSGLTVGQIFVSTDTFKVFYADTETTFTEGVLILSKSFIVKSDTGDFYVFTGSELIAVSGGSGGGNTSSVATTTPLTESPNGVSATSQEANIDLTANVNNLYNRVSANTEAIANFSSASMSVLAPIGTIPEVETRIAWIEETPSTDTDILDYDTDDYYFELKKIDFRYQLQGILLAFSTGNGSKTITFRSRLQDDDTLLNEYVDIIEGGNNQYYRIFLGPTFIDNPLEQLDMYITWECSDDEVDVVAGGAFIIGDSVGTGGIVSSYSDEAFEIYNILDPTKILKFNNANIPTDQILTADANNVANASSFVKNWIPDKVYYPNQWCLDGGWGVMVQNDGSVESTTERPSPSLIGGAFKTYDGTLVEQSEVAKQLILGVKKTAEFDQLLYNYPVYTVEGQYYYGYYILNPDTNPVMHSMGGFIATSTGVRDFPMGNIILLEGDVINIFVTVRTNTPSTTATFDASLNHAGGAASGVPAAGFTNMYVGGSYAYLAVSTTDQNSNDITAGLTALSAGDLISGAGVEWSILEVIETDAAFVRFSVAPASFGNGGISTFTFTTIAAEGIFYGYDENYYLNNAYAGGLFAVDTGFENLIRSDSAFGVDVEAEQIDIASDWMILFAPSLSSASISSSDNIPNIIATQGVGADATKPVTGLVVNDVFVSNDTYLKYIAISTTEWNDGEALIAKQFITDSSSASNDLYQYNGSVLLTLKGSVSQIIVPIYSEVITDTDPGNNNFTLNSLDITAISRINISKVINGIDLSDTMTGLLAGSRIILLQASDNTKFINITLNVDAIDETTYVYCDDFTVDDYGDIFDDGEECLSNFEITQASSGGGHTLQEQQDEETPVNAVQQTNLLFRFANGVASIFNNVTNLSTDIILKFRGMNDYDASGENAGDAIVVNSAGDGYEPNATKIDETVYAAIPEANIGDGFADVTHVEISTIWLYGRTCSGWLINETDNTITGAVITDGTNNLHTPVTLASGESAFVTFDMSYSDPTNDIDLYAYATTWNSGTLTFRQTQIEN